MSTTADFPTWLGKQMAERNLNQSELGRLSGVSQRTISNYLTGVRVNYDKESLVKLARGLNLPPEEIFIASGTWKRPIGDNPIIKRIMYFVNDLPPEELQNVLEYSELRHRIAEDRGGSDAKKNKRKPTLLRNT